MAAQCGLNHSSNFFSRATARITKRIETLVDQEVFCPGVMHRNGQAQFLHDVGHRSGLLAHRLAERNLQIVPQNGQHHSRNPPAGADIQTRSRPG